MLGDQQKRHSTIHSRKCEQQGGGRGRDAAELRTRHKEGREQVAEVLPWEHGDRALSWGLRLGEVSPQDFRLWRPGGLTLGKARGLWEIESTPKGCTQNLTHSVVVVVSHSVLPGSLQPHGLLPARLPCPWDSQARTLKWVALWELGKKQQFWKDPGSNPCADLWKPFGEAGKKWRSPWDIRHWHQPTLSARLPLGHWSWQAPFWNPPSPLLPWGPGHAQKLALGHIRPSN